jgi:hypothetical protein
MGEAPLLYIVGLAVLGAAIVWTLLALASRKSPIPLETDDERMDRGI